MRCFRIVFQPTARISITGQHLRATRAIPQTALFAEYPIVKESTPPGVDGAHTLAREFPNTLGALRCRHE